MTDMRATERLLEVIEDNAERLAFLMDGNVTFSPDELPRRSKEIAEAVGELRRRGDTLVRRDDLRLVVEEAISDRFSVEQEFSVTGGRAEDERDQASGYTAALNRLEIALGGKLR